MYDDSIMLKKRDRQAGRSMEASLHRYSNLS